MKLAFVGLGKMGANMVRRLVGGGHEIVVMNRSYEVADALSKELGKQVVAAKTLEEMIEQLPGQKVVWMMIPEGKPVDDTIAQLLPMLAPGDILIDGGNSNFKQTKQRGEMLSQHGIDYLDAGTSGGIWGLQVGYCLMVGGSEKGFATIEPILKTLAPKDGYLRTGATGAGHYTKMIHNGIEYGIMQAYAEGFDILENSGYDMDLHAICKLWNQGSVVRSWLLELCENMFAENPKLENLAPYVPDSGEGRWTVQESIDLSVPAPVIAMSLIARFQSRQDNSFASRSLAAMRNQFGGHAVKKQ